MDTDRCVLLDSSIWREITNRRILSNGYVYAGRKLVEKYDVIVFIKPKEQ